MSQLMKTLFSTLELSGQSEAEAQVIKETSDAFRAAEQRLTYEEFEKMWSAIVEISSACQLDIFTQGFRLGVQLTLEGLRPVYPTDPAAASAPPCPPR